MKLSKALSMMMNNEKFDIEYSKIIETSKTKGTIVLSIDPVDYVLMSLNKSGWSSCHTLHGSGSGVDFGCYSAGTLSYMCDEDTLIGYRHSDKIYDYQINKVKFKEYSKNWRQVFYYDKGTHAFIASRQYPFNDENISKELRSMFEEVLSNKFGFDNKWKALKNSYSFNDRIDDKNNLHYNDISHEYKGTLCYPKGTEYNEILFEVGSYPICPICGNWEVTEAHIPCCSECI